VADEYSPANLTADNSRPSAQTRILRMQAATIDDMSQLY